MAKKAASKAKSVIVTVADEAIGDIQNLAKELTAKGLKVDKVMPVMGVVSGSCATAKMADLRSISGVLSVEEEATAHPSGPEATA